MFKLLAIEITRPHDEEVVSLDRYKSIHKIMSFKLEDYADGAPASRIYYFHDGYKCENSHTKIIAKTATPDTFYSNDGLNISFTAIVGENGMGKSTILEIFFRLMNNVSCALRSGIDSSTANWLIFVPDLYARAYFEDSDGSFFVLEQYDNNIIFFDQKTETTRGYDFSGNFFNKPSKEEHDLCVSRLSKLFYTVVVNYASYAYNTTDYMNEWVRTEFKFDGSGETRCWLSPLFHKNDSYQTPIVLNPFRESGNVDYNNERTLTQERLFKLVLNQHSPLKRILHKKDAKAIVFDLNKEYFPFQKRNHYDSKRVRWIVDQLDLVEYKGRKGNAELTSLGDCIIRAWSRCMGFNLDGTTKTYWASDERVCAINYLVYKTLKIVNTYPSYKTLKHQLMFRKESDESQNAVLRKVVRKIYEDRSHITIKLRRCLAYLLFKHYTSKESLVNNEMIGRTIDIDVLKSEIDKCIKDPTGYLKVHYEDGGEVPVIQYAQKKPIKWTLNELIPASCFHTDLLLQDEDGNQVSFNLLSSGEKQMIHSMSAILYQISNIDSAWENKADQAHYSKICLVFDEVELYFHPKYQLKLVSFLIETLNGLNLENIKDIQIILATHSPFILSDLPKSDVLMLKDGRQFITEENASNPFCANVFDILNSQFFMDNFVGEFAESKLDNIIKKVKFKDYKPEELEELKREVSLIGDNYVRNTLLQKIGE